MPLENKKIIFVLNMLIEPKYFKDLHTDSLLTVTHSQCGSGKQIPPACVSI